MLGRWWRRWNRSVSVASAFVRSVSETSTYTSVVGSWNVSCFTAGSLETEELSKVLCCFGVVPEDVLKRSLASIHLVAFCFRVVVHRDSKEHEKWEWFFLKVIFLSCNQVIILKVTQSDLMHSDSSPLNSTLQIKVKKGLFLAFDNTAHLSSSVEGCLNERQQKQFSSRKRSRTAIFCLFTTSLCSWTD